MKRFERPFINPMLESKLRGLSPRAIEIAEDPVLQLRIHDFMLSAVDRPTFIADGHEFDLHRNAMVGKTTLLSVYDQLSTSTLPVREAQVAISANFDHEELVIDPWYTLSVEKPYGDPSTELILGVPDDLDDIDLDLPGLTEIELEAESIKLWSQVEREWQALPRVYFGGNEIWRIERDGECELMTKLTDVVDQVRLVISRSIGKAAFERFDPTSPLIKKQAQTQMRPIGYLDTTSSIDGTGQSEQMMVA